MALTSFTHKNMGGEISLQAISKVYTVKKANICAASSKTDAF